jgi:hypothetical protein
VHHSLSAAARGGNFKRNAALRVMAYANGRLFQNMVNVSPRPSRDVRRPSSSCYSTPCFTIVNVCVMRPANYFKKRAAWIIEWQTYREDSPIRSFRPHILPWRWRSERVFDYMRCLYWNSGLWTPFEIVVRVNKREPEGMLMERYSAPMLIGDGACSLIGSPVNDLCIEKDDAGQITMEWTRPPRYQHDNASGRAMPVGTPLKQRFVWQGC